jgi:hypothetical protein
VGSDAEIAGDQRHALEHRLGDEKPVEGIALRLAAQLDVREPAIGRGVGGGYGEANPASSRKARPLGRWSLVLESSSTAS